MEPLRITWISSHTSSAPPASHATSALSGGGLLFHSTSLAMERKSAPAIDPLRTQGRRAVLQAPKKRKGPNTPSVAK